MERTTIKQKEPLLDDFGNYHLIKIARDAKIKT